MTKLLGHARRDAERDLAFVSLFTGKTIADTRSMNVSTEASPTRQFSGSSTRESPPLIDIRNRIVHT